MNATGSIKSLMDTTLETIKGAIDANTIVGDPIKNNNTMIVPISKVTIGFGIGGGEYSKGSVDKTTQDTEPNFAGGSGAAISVQPVAFVVVEDGETRLMSLDQNLNMIDNILSVTPKVIEKIQNLSRNKNGKDEDIDNCEEINSHINETHKNGEYRPSDIID